LWAKTLNIHKNIMVSQAFIAVAIPCSLVRGVDVTLLFVGAIETVSRRIINQLSG
jgi:hypothetical protein